MSTYSSYMYFIFIYLRRYEHSRDDNLQEYNAVDSSAEQQQQHRVQQNASVMRSLDTTAVTSRLDSSGQALDSSEDCAVDDESLDDTLVDCSHSSTSSSNSSTSSYYGVPRHSSCSSGARNYRHRRRRHGYGGRSATMTQSRSAGVLPLLGHVTTGARRMREWYEEDEEGGNEEQEEDYEELQLEQSYSSDEQSGGGGGGGGIRDSDRWIAEFE